MEMEEEEEERGTKDELVLYYGMDWRNGILWNERVPCC
jgi:hypothetical protein